MCLYARVCCVCVRVCECVCVCVCKQDFFMLVSTRTQASSLRGAVFCVWVSVFLLCVFAMSIGLVLLIACVQAALRHHYGY